MSDRQKYALRGVCFFENVRELMERNNFPEIPIGTIGGIDGWYLTMQQKIIDDEMYYYPFIYTDEKRPTFKFCKYFNILKNDGSSEIPEEWFSYLEPKYGSTGSFKTVFEYLNENNGWLTNGGIKIEYGFQIEGILDRDKIWTFNFHDCLFDCQEKANMVSFFDFIRDDEKNSSIVINSHGVRGRKHVNGNYTILDYAKRYNFLNVIQIIDQQLKTGGIHRNLVIRFATAFGMNHCLAGYLRKEKSLEKIAYKLKGADIRRMSGEMMKKCVKRFFEDYE